MTRRAASPPARCWAIFGANWPSTRARHREDLASLVEHPAAERSQHARAVMDAIETLRHLPVPAPIVTDDVERWLPARAAGAMKAHGFRTLAELTVRIPRRRRWWTAIPGLGAAGARQIEAFFAAHPHLTQQARALVPIGAQHDVVPWERLRVPDEVNGSRGTFRAPKATCTLVANNDYEAVQAWLGPPRVRRNPASLPQGGRKADSLGRRRALPGAVLTHERRRGCLSRLSAAPGAQGSLDRSGPAAVLAIGGLLPVDCRRDRWPTPCRWWARCSAG
jgi:hypothetical protein